MDRLSKKKTEAAEAKVSKERIAGVAGSAVLLPFAFTLACRIIDAVSRVQLMITLDPYLHWLTTWWGQSTELIVGLLLLYGATVFEHKREAESHSLIFRPGGSHDGKPGLPAPKPKQQFVWIKIAVLPIACGIILAVVVWASIRFRTHQIKPPISTALPTEAAPAGPTVLPAQNHLSPQHKRAINQLPAPIPPNPIVHSSVAQSPPTPVPTAPNQGADDAPLTMSDPLVCPAPEKLVDAWFATLEQLASGVPAVNGPIEFSVDGPGRLMSVLHPLIRDKYAVPRRAFRDSGYEEASAFLKDLDSHLSSPDSKVNRYVLHGVRRMNTPQSIQVGYVDCVGGCNEILNAVPNVPVEISVLSKRSQTFITTMDKVALNDAKRECDDVLRGVKDAMQPQ